MQAITTENQYNSTLEVIETYLQKGSANMTPDDKQELRRLSLLVEAFEQQMYPLPLPAQSLTGMIQIKMFERQLKQKELALLLEISETTLSEVLKGKRKVNMNLAKKLYKKLEIPSDFILETA